MPGAAVEPEVRPGRSAEGNARGCRPAAVVDVELSRPVAPLSSSSTDGREYRSAWVLVRIFEEPVALLPIDFFAGTVSIARLVRSVEERCGATVRSRVLAAGGDPDAVLAGLGTTLAAQPVFARDHHRWLREGPEITVVICTRDRPEDLTRALQSLQAQSYPRFRVMVVDNAPTDGATACLVHALQKTDSDLEYALERRPGLSWARNRALGLIDTPVVAWLDDDEIADEHWLMEIAGAFCVTPDASAVSGSVVPAELETQSQLWFEQYGGHTKGRGFAPVVFRGREAGGQSPVYPLPAFGVGANMAFATSTLRELGGFDTALGAGTPTQGGEDTLVFSQILLDGGTVVYRPSALTRHFHRRGYEALAHQMSGYGIGLTAYYTSLVRHDWRLVFSLARLAPRALRDTFGSGGDGMASVPPDFPRELLKLKTRGMLRGPFAYRRARRTSRRLAVGAP